MIGPGEEEIPGVGVCDQELPVTDRCWFCSLRSLRQQQGVVISVFCTQVIQRHHGTCTGTSKTLLITQSRFRSKSFYDILTN